MPRIIYAPSNGPACSMEDLVAQYIDWSPTIYNDVSQGFYMAPEQMQYCPTKAQIKNSESMSVTLYKQAVYEDSSIIQFKKGTTYKFNGEIGQFPKLYVLDMYPDFKPTKQYSSKELVKLCDVSAFYNHHEITLRLNNFSLIKDQFPKVSSNLVNVYVATDYALYLYDMKEETYFSWSLPTIDSIANGEQYRQDKFTYNVIGYDNLADSYTLGNTINVTDVERDVTIDVYAVKKDLINVYISTDGRVRVINYLSEIDLSSEEAVGPNIIIDPPNTYATYKTDYPEEKYDRFKFLIQPDDAESLESYKYEFKKNGELIDSSSNVFFTDKSYIYVTDLSYRDVDTSAPNSYTLMITTKEKYRGNTIRIIINNEVAYSLEIEVSEESSYSGFETIYSKTTSSKMEFSYVIQKETTTTLYIKVIGNKNLLKDYDLIKSIYASNNRGYSTAFKTFGNNLDSVVLEWKGGVGRNTIIYIKIERVQLVNITIKRLTEDISVYNIYSNQDVIFDGNSAIISTTKGVPSIIYLKVTNHSSSNNVINYKWYVRSKVEEDRWPIGKDGYAYFVKTDLLPGQNYMLELKGSIAYTEKIVSIIINNNDPSTHIAVNSGEWSEYGDYYNTLGQPSSENEGNTVKYKYTMAHGYYFRGTIHVDEDYMISSCSYTCKFYNMSNSQMGSEIFGSVKINESTNNFVIIIQDIPAECSYVEISTTYTRIPTYSITVASVAHVNVYEYDYKTGMFKAEPICTAENKYEASVNTIRIKPKEIQLRFVSDDQESYPSLTYTVYDTVLERQTIVSDDQESYPSLTYTVYDTAPERQTIVSETTMDITGDGTIWTSPSGMFDTYRDGIYFQVMSLTYNRRTIYIYTKLTNVKLIIKDKYNNDNVIADFSSNDGSDYVSYKTVSGYYDKISWDITLPPGYTSCELELFGSNDDNATSPTSGNWIKVGSTKTEFSDTTLNFVWGQDLDGNNATKYTKYYIKFSNFAVRFEYIGISTAEQSIYNINNYKSTNVIPTTEGNYFNVLFRIPTASGDVSIKNPPVVNDGVWVNPDGTSVSSPHTPFRSFCENSSNSSVIKHTDGYTYIFYGFSENLELYGKYYIDNTKYIYTNQIIKNAITFKNPLTTDTMDIDVSLGEICKLSWSDDCSVGAGEYKEFSTDKKEYLEIYANLKRILSSNCDTSSSELVYGISSEDLINGEFNGGEFNGGDFNSGNFYDPGKFSEKDLMITPKKFKLRYFLPNSSDGGSATWGFSHETFNDGSTFTATLQHEGRTLSLPLKAVQNYTPQPYGIYFWYTKNVTYDLDTRWYLWTTEDLSTTLLRHYTDYGVLERVNTPTTTSNLIDGYYKFNNRSDIAYVRNKNEDGPGYIKMLHGQRYVLVYSTRDGLWHSTGVKFTYKNPSNLTEIPTLICDGDDKLEGKDCVKCHYL